MAAKTEPVVNVVLQFDGKSVDVADVSKAAKNAGKRIIKKTSGNFISI